MTDFKVDLFRAKTLMQNINRYWLGFFVLTAVYVVLYGWFLWFTDALPYVLDNNESFSALGHAYNLYHGDLSKSFGLTDEAFSALPEAHPMIHTHQGDWPRIFAFLIYALGARSIESQIVVTTFTVGLSAMWLMYYYFARISTIFFALLACVVMMTDYIMFTEWQVNTYRVWHVFFVFSSLVCVHKLDSPNQKRWVLLTILNYACLFYGELVFATFVAIWAGLYTIALYFRQFKKIILGGVSQLCGVVISLGILVAQLTAFMGWKNFVKDLSLTFVARNATADASEFGKILSEFYNNMNIVFFYNIQDGSVYKNIPTFIKSFFQYGFQIYSSLFSLVVFILCSLWVFSLSSSLSKKCLTSQQYYQAIGLVGIFFALILSMMGLNGGIGFLNGFLVFAMIIVSGFLLCGFSYPLNHKKAIIGLAVPLFVFCVAFGRYYFPQIQISILVFLLIGFSISYGLSWFIVISSNLQCNNSKDRISVFSRIVLVTLFILAVSVFIDMQDFLYDIGLKEVWLNALSSFYPLCVWFFIVTVLVCMVSIVILAQQQKYIINGGSKEKLVFVAYYLAIGILAYTIVYYLSSGYLFSGYLTRYTPFHVFIISVLISVALYTFFMLAKFFVKIAYAYWSVERYNFEGKLKKGVIFFPVRLFSAIMCVGIFGLIIAQWFFVQYQYFHFLPPTVFRFVKILKSEQFRGRSSVSNTYSLPFAIQTNRWSFHDTGIASGKLNLGSAGYAFPHNPLYLWFADRKTNLAYSRPDLFVCFANQGMETALQHYKYPESTPQICSAYHLVRQALSLEPNRLEHMLVKRDEKNDMWAIVKINWDFPPYLIRKDDGSPNVILNSSRVKNDIIIDVRYFYKQQNGIAETSSLVGLHPVIRGKSSCSLGPAVVQKHVHGGKAQLQFRKSGDISEYVVVVTPKSVSRVGDKWTSHIIDFSHGGIKIGAECRRWRENDNSVVIH